MKRMIRPLWRLSAPVRRPILRKFDEHMMRLFAQMPRAAEAPPVILERPAEAPPVILERPAEPPADLELLLNSVVRELGRLQMQVEVLQEKVDDLRASGHHGARVEDRLSLIGEAG